MGNKNKEAYVTRPLLLLLFSHHDMNLLGILQLLPPHSSANQALYVHVQLVPAIERNLCRRKTTQKK